MAKETEIVLQNFEYSLDNKFIKKSQFEKLLDFIKDLAKTNKEYENILNKHGLRIA